MHHSELGALQPELGAAAQLLGGFGRRTRRQAPDHCEAIGSRAREVCDPVVVDAHDDPGYLGILQASDRAEDAVQHLAGDAVEILIHHPQRGIGWAHDAAGLIVVQALLGHAIRAMDLTGHVGPAG